MNMKTLTPKKLARGRYQIGKLIVFSEVPKIRGAVPVVWKAEGRAGFLGYTLNEVLGTARRKGSLHYDLAHGTQFHSLSRKHADKAVRAPSETVAVR